MAVISQSELKQELVSKWEPDQIAEIIDKLAGGKSNLRIDLGEIRLTLGDKEYELAGVVNFDVTEKNNGHPVYDRVRINQGLPDHKVPAYESGKVHVSTGDVEVLRVNVGGKRIEVDLEDKQFIKRLIRLRNELVPKKSEAQEKKAQKKKSSPLATVRTIANTCKKLGITVTVSYKGHRIATMGTEARPMLLQHVTKTNALAINSMYTAIELMV